MIVSKHWTRSKFSLFTIIVLVLRLLYRCNGLGRGEKALFVSKWPKVLTIHFQRQGLYCFSALSAVSVIISLSESFWSDFIHVLSWFCFLIRFERTGNKIKKKLRYPEWLDCALLEGPSKVSEEYQHILRRRLLLVHIIHSEIQNSHPSYFTLKNLWQCNQWI